MDINIYIYIGISKHVQIYIVFQMPRVSCTISIDICTIQFPAFDIFFVYMQFSFHRSDPRYVSFKILLTLCLQEKPVGHCHHHVASVDVGMSPGTWRCQCQEIRLMGTKNPGPTATAATAAPAVEGILILKCHEVTTSCFEFLYARLRLGTLLKLIRFIFNE